MGIPPPSGGVGLSAAPAFAYGAQQAGTAPLSMLACSSPNARRRDAAAKAQFEKISAYEIISIVFVIKI